MKNLFRFLFRRLEAGLVLYGLYTCGIYWDHADGWDDDLHSLLYGERRVTE